MNVLVSWGRQTSCGTAGQVGHNQKSTGSLFTNEGRNCKSVTGWFFDL